MPSPNRREVGAALEQFGNELLVVGFDEIPARGGPIEVIRPGDRVFFGPGEDHWHGAAPKRFMTHLAMLEVDDKGNSATWGPHVSDEKYGAAPKMEDA